MQHKEYKYIFGPVPSRRMGISLGISPVIKKSCNYSCVYCQIGRTDKMTNKRQEFFKVSDIIDEVKDYLKENIKFDVVTIVGEGEPTLYSKIDELILELKKLVDKPIALITNGGLLYDKNVREQIKMADIILPSLDAPDEESWKKINRPYGKLKFDEVYDGLIKLSQEYKGQLWLEIMLVKDINDSKESLLKFKELIANVKYDRLFINTPVRPPAEKWVQQLDKEEMRRANDILHGKTIDTIVSQGFFSEEKDNYKAILSIIRRHPMNQFEINTLLKERKCENIEEIYDKLNSDKNIEIVDYKGYKTFRLK